MAVGSPEEAGESILRMVDQVAHVTQPIRTWVSGELMFYLPFHRDADVTILYQTLSVVVVAN